MEKRGFRPFSSMTHNATYARIRHGASLEHVLLVSLHSSYEVVYAQALTRLRQGWDGDYANTGDFRSIIGDLRLR